MIAYLNDPLIVRNHTWSKKYWLAINSLFISQHFCAEEEEEEAYRAARNESLSTARFDEIFRQQRTVAPKSKCAENKFTYHKFLQIYIISVSGCLRFTFCQIVADTSMIRQFDDFLKSYFWCFFCNLAQLCGVVQQPLRTVQLRSA